MFTMRVKTITKTTVTSEIIVSLRHESDKKHLAQQQCGALHRAQPFLLSQGVEAEKLPTLFTMI